MKLDDFNLDMSVKIEQNEICKLPHNMQNCYEYLCKYAKPSELFVGATCDEIGNNIALYITLVDEIEDECVKCYTEGEDFELTAEERTAIITMMMETVTKSILATA